jgi:hypothetical protein
MYCQECGKEAQPGEAMCASCGGALTDTELDLPEVAAFPLDLPAGAGEQGQPAAVAMPADPGMAAAAAPATPSSATPPPTGPRLEIAVGGLSGFCALDGEVITIGRSDPAAGLRPQVDLSMDSAVSRRHAEIRRGAGGYRIIDLGSTNGIIVNGRQVPRQQEIPLADGDEIRLGENCKLTVRLQ